ncbi:MAG: ABC transporter ATP-binding protein [Anaerolineae bacterium]|nr:ABC transporter ATP-binding protein [Anaerolineae bacterium]
MTSEIVSIRSVSRSFGDLKVIRDLNMTVREKSVFGFIGKNGAGKTTTMKMILGFLKPDAGSIAICGEAVRYGNTHTNRMVGYLPDVPEFYSYMTPREYLRLCGEMTGLSPARTKARIKELLPLVGLDGAAKRKVKGFSRGMKQRLGIAQALLHEPRLLICDEPTSALDPVGRREILDILANVREQTTIIFSTHILSDVEKICDTIGILNNGRIVLEGNISDLKDDYRSDKITLEVNGGESLPVFVEMLTSLASITELRQENHTFRITTSNLPETSTDVIRILNESGVQLRKFEVQEPELEQLFIEVTR